MDDGEHWLALAQGLHYRVPCVTNCSYALEFDGDQNYAVADSSTAFNPDAATIECWFKTTSTTPAVLLSTDSRDTREGWMLSFNWLSGNELAWWPDWYSPLCPTHDDNCNAYLVGNHAVNDGNWHPIAITYDGTGTVTLWYDGSEDDSKSYTPSDTHPNRPLWVARWWEDPHHDSGPTFGGAITQVRSSSIVRYTSSFTPATSFTTDSDTIAYYKFSEGDGSTVADETSNHDATLEGSPLPNWVEGR